MSRKRSLRRGILPFESSILRLPDEIMRSILLYMDRGAFITSRAVCKRFYFAGLCLYEQLYKSTWNVVHGAVPASLSRHRIHAAHDRFGDRAVISSWNRDPMSELLGHASLSSMDTEEMLHSYVILHSTLSPATSSLPSSAPATVTVPHATGIGSTSPRDDLVVAGSTDALSPRYSPPGGGPHTCLRYRGFPQMARISPVMAQSSLSVEQQLTIERWLFWKDLYLERCRILHCFHTGSGKKKARSKRHGKSLDVDEFNDQGYREIYRDNFSDAIVCFERSIRIKRNARAYEGLSRIYSSSMYFSPSHVIIFTEAALQFDPVNIAELFFLRGKALMSMQRLEEANEDFTRCIEYLTLSQIHHLFLRNSEVYHCRMMTSLELGGYDEALKDCARLSESDRIDRRFYQGGGDCYLQCARILLGRRQYEPALRFLHSVQTRNRDFHLVSLAVHSQLGHFEEALEHFEVFRSMAGQRCTIQPDHEIYMDIAITLFMNGIFDQAIDYWWACLARITCADGLPLLAMRDGDLLCVKRHTLSVALRQRRDFEAYYEQQDSLFAFDDIHIAWSYYYFHTGMTYAQRYLSRLTLSRRVENSEDLRWGLTNFTRAITLNPTLSEAFYMRALLQCYLLFDQLLAVKRSSQPHTQHGRAHQRPASMSASSNSSSSWNNHDQTDVFSVSTGLHHPADVSLSTEMSTSNSGRDFSGRFSNRNIDSSRSTYRHSSPLQGLSPIDGRDDVPDFSFHAQNSSGLRRPVLSPSSQHKRIAQRIMGGNLLRESLNDINNAYALIMMDISEHLTNDNALLMLSDLIDQPLRRRREDDIENEQLMIFIADLHLLKAYVLGCLGRADQALQEIEWALQLAEGIRQRQHESRNARQRLRLAQTGTELSAHYAVANNPLFQGDVEDSSDEVAHLYDIAEMELMYREELEVIAGSRWFDEDSIAIEPLPAIHLSPEISKSVPGYLSAESAEYIATQCSAVRAILAQNPTGMGDAFATATSSSVDCGGEFVKGFHKMLGVLLSTHLQRMSSLAESS